MSALFVDRHRAPSRPLAYGDGRDHFRQSRR